MPSEGSVTWITGASLGIGAELARQLSGPAVKLVLTARNIERLEAVAISCRARGSEVVILPADLLSAEERERVVQAALAAFGRVDTVIHAAGISQRATADEVRPEVLRSLMEVDFFAPVELTRALFPTFRKQGHGMVVAIGSVAGLMGFPLRSGYCAAKHALTGWFETLQVERPVPGLHALLVHPGRIRTDISLHALTADGTPQATMDAGQRNGMPVEVCARMVFRAMRQRRYTVVIGGKERMLWWCWWFLPSTFRRMARRFGGR